MLGTRIIVVDSGHELIDQKTGKTHVVKEGAIVFSGDGRSLYCVEQDYQRLKRRTIEADP